MEENKKPDNPQAFPMDYRHEGFRMETGMTLRDYFAIKEKIVLSNLFWSNKSFQKTIVSQAKEEKLQINVLLCEIAYDAADEMLKQRDL